MPLVTTRGSLCAFCVFRTSPWQAGQFKALGGNRLFSTKGSPLLRTGGKKGSIHGPPIIDYDIPNEIHSKKRDGKGKHIDSSRSPGFRLPQRFRSSEAARSKIVIRQTPHKISFGDRHLRLKYMKSLFLDFAKEYKKMWQNNKEELLGWGIKSEEEFTELYEKFITALKECCVAEKPELNKDISASDPCFKLYEKLKEAYVEKGGRGLRAQMKYSFAKSVVASRFSAADVENQTRIADLRFPPEWYPATRSLQRHIHLHVGPTNSGKTYHALKRLEAAKTGVYAGPLRLLAHEVYTRLNAKNIPCALVTGEERRIPDTMKHYMLSCTVEMVPLNQTLDVAVIDEIQMIGDVDRGWAWTQAFLGVQAKEVHLCGELRTVPLIEKLCASIGDKLTIHRYERLSPLETMSTSLKGDLTKLRKGDCVILFSRVGIHAMKKEIERTTKKRCAVVYGSLPPETRAQQAALFNDPNNDYDFLAASDAVGMGLNLSIKRIIFETTSKFNGYSMKPCSTSDIKQIGGRAGRFKTAAQATTKPEGPTNAGVNITDGAAAFRNGEKTLGLVTTLEDIDLPNVAVAMADEAEPILTAGIFPPSSILQRFAAYFPSNTSFSYILLRLNEISMVQGTYHLCNLKDQLQIADVIQPYDLTTTDRITFCSSPANFGDAGSVQICSAFAKCIAENRGGDILDIPELRLELLDEESKSSMDYLRELEALHKGITLYLWLSYRFAGVFPSQDLAFHIKGLVEAKIDVALGEFEGLSKLQRQRRRILQSQQIQEVKRTRRLLSEMDKSP